MPFMTVMIPVYNGERYLADAIGSALSQPCGDLEVLVLDDGSTDGTASVARRAAEADPRVRVRSHPNYGLGRNRNDGMPLVRGELLVFLDHDDVLAPGFYTEGLREAVRSLFSAGVEVVVPSRIIADDSLSRGAVDRVPLDGLHPGAGRASLELPYEFATMLYSTALLRREGVLFSETRPEMESIFRHKAAFCSPWVLFDNSFRFAVRRDHPGQITKNWDEAEVARVRLQENERLLAWHEARGTRGEVLDAIRGRVEAARSALEERPWEREGPRGPVARLLDRRRRRRDREAWLSSLDPVAGLYLGPGEVEEACARWKGAALEAASRRR